MKSICTIVFTAIFVGCTNTPKGTAPPSEGNVEGTTLTERTNDSVANDTAQPPQTERHYTKNELEQLSGLIAKRIKKTDKVVASCVSGWSVTGDAIEISMKINSPEMQREFRKYIVDSPALRFVGNAEPPIYDKQGVSSVDGVSLSPERATYPRNTEYATFVLVNNSGTSVCYGEDYKVAFNDGKGAWRELPTADVFNAVGYEMPSGKSAHFKAWLNPKLNGNRPGVYRYFHEVSIGDGKGVLMMAEFRIADDG